jgi:hypothetical protein
MERQKILAGPTSPILWAIIDEAALRRTVGSPEVTKAQLKRLADIGSRRIVVQVLPYSTGAHACMDGAMMILSDRKGPDMVYREGPGSGQLISDEEEVQLVKLRYDLVKAAALTPEASAEFLQKIIAEEV